MSLPNPMPDGAQPLKSEEIEERRRQREINQPAIDWLNSWDDATDEERAEQRESYELLIKALNENQARYRTLSE